MDNAEIASALEEVAHHLDEAGVKPRLVSAYRATASTIRWLDRPLERILAEEGERGLRRVEHVDDRTAEAIEEIVTTGHLDLLDDLRSDLEPAHVLDRVRGISRLLAEDIEERLGIVSLDELAAAAWDGRLERLVGPDELARIRRGIAERLGGREVAPLAGHPPVAELLAVDREYREEAAAGRLHRIAPRRYNPLREMWLPVLHTERNQRGYSALYSNSQLAHKRGRVGDWVIVYSFGLGRVRQDMVVTESEGDLAGRRVVRGREEESREQYMPAARHA